jgi:hypothetical protein
MNTMNSNPLQKDPVRYAKRMGGRVYLVASILIAVLFGGLMFISLALQWSVARNWEGIDDELADVQRQRIRWMILVAFVTLALFCVLGWLGGRMAGVAIQVRKRKFGWVGLWALLPAASVTTLVFVLSMNLIFDNWPDNEREFTKAIVYPFLTLFGIVYGCCIVAGILSGLIVRQYGYHFADRERLASMEEF